MSHQRKSTQRKALKSPTSPTNDGFWQFIEQSSSSTSTASSSTSLTQRCVYPNVPKRTQRMSAIDEYEPMQTDSRITIVPRESHSPKSNGAALTTDQNAHTRLSLNLISKYTSPPKPSRTSDKRSSSSTENNGSTASNQESSHDSKPKRTLSPPWNETSQLDHASKRTKSFDEDDDAEEELSQLLDHRRSRQILSQSAAGDAQKQPTGRKPTARKLSNAQQRPSISQTQPEIRTTWQSPETLIIEPDIDPEDDTTTNLEATTSAVSSSTSKLEGHLSRSMPADSNLLDSSMKQTPVKQGAPSNRSSLNSALKRTLEQPIDHSSPRSSRSDRRFSGASTNSLFYETPQSSLSRTTTNMTSTSVSPTILKQDCETQTLPPSQLDMLSQLIMQTNLNVTPNSTKIDFNPVEVSKKLFHHYNSFPVRTKYPTINNLIKKQYLHIGRYEIEVRFASNVDEIATIHICDLCLKNFRGSALAYQRHLSKCSATQPPGKLVYEENDLAIFQIVDTKMNLAQRLYIKSLCQITRLFTEPDQSVDDQQIDRFGYYILCRRDPILSQSQSSLYRFIGYFSQRLHQSGQLLVNNLSCLFILPPFTRHEQYHQLLIAFSYFLIRSNASFSQTYSSPARPLDHFTLASFQAYWRDVIFTYLNNQKPSPVQTIALDTLARHTSLHPRDILSSLYSTHSLVAHPTDKSSIHLRYDPSHSMRPLNTLMKNQSTNPIVQNLATTDNSSVEEIVLD